VTAESQGFPLPVLSYLERLEPTLPLLRLRQRYRHGETLFHLHSSHMENRVFAATLEFSAVNHVSEAHIIFLHIALFLVLCAYVLPRTLRLKQCSTPSKHSQGSLQNATYKHLMCPEGPCFSSELYNWVPQLCVTVLIFFAVFSHRKSLASSQALGESANLSRALKMSGVTVTGRHDWFYYTSTKCAIPDDMAGQQRFWGALVTSAQH
jgi:hypothetical protein